MKAAMRFTARHSGTVAAVFVGTGSSGAVMKGGRRIEGVLCGESLEYCFKNSAYIYIERFSGAR